MDVEFAQLPDDQHPWIMVTPGPKLTEHGYEMSEWTAAGEATAYDLAEFHDDGRMDVTSAENARYRTRIIVRRPKNPEDFSGVTLVEWFNVTSGQDAGPAFSYVGEEIVRQGHAWVGVSAQYVGIEGGEPLFPDAGGTHAKAGKPERYGELSHPGDAFAFDIYTRIGRALREPHGEGPLSGLETDTLLAIGESQSAYALTTYANAGFGGATGEGERVFDGYFVHSRGGGHLPLGVRGRGVAIADMATAEPTKFRTDLAVPLICVVAEADVSGMLDYFRARQPETDSIRVWEIAGSAHADKFLIGEFEEFLGSSVPVNSGQQTFVLRAALRSLLDWVRGEGAPASADEIEMEGLDIVRDEIGNARGGVRTPVVDAPVDLFHAAATPGLPPFAAAFGATATVDESVLREKWADRDAYLSAYEEATDRLIDEGFLLADDRAEILDDARPERITW